MQRMQQKIIPSTTNHRRAATEVTYDSQVNQIVRNCLTNDNFIDITDDVSADTVNPKYRHSGWCRRTIGTKIVGIDGNVHRRREEILDSHCFVCECPSCVTEATSIITLSSSADDYEALEFIDRILLGEAFTAAEALEKSETVPNTTLRSSMFGKAMTDTSMQLIAHDLETAFRFQKLALQSLELRCPECHITIAYEILRLCLLQMRDGERNDQNEIDRARVILRRYYGTDYAYKRTLDAFLRNATLTRYQ